MDEKIVESKPVEQPKAEQIQNTQQPQNTQQTVKEEKPEETPKDINWKAFKEARDTDRKRAEAESKRASEKEAEANALKAALDAVLNKPQTQQQFQQPQYGYEQPEETEEQRVNRLVKEAIDKRERERETESKRVEMQEYPKRLNQDYRDFNQVCSADNLDYLDYHYPEVSKACSHMPEGYEKWATIYKAVKRFIPNTNVSKDIAKAERNAMKPQSMSAPGPTSTNNDAPAWKLDEARKAANYARMMKTIHRMD